MEPEPMEPEPIIILVYECQNVVLRCNCSGSEARWIKDNNVIVNTSYNIIYTPPYSYLHIKEVDNTDSGSFVCDVDSKVIKTYFLFVGSKLNWQASKVMRHYQSLLSRVFKAAG